MVPLVSCRTRRSFFLLTVANVTIWIAMVHHLLSVSHGVSSLVDVIPSPEKISISVAGYQHILPRLREMIRERHSALRQTCNQSWDQIPHLTNETFDSFARFIIVDREWKIMYCPVPKAASTTWKAFFMEISGIRVSADVHRKERDSLLHLSDMTKEEREIVLRDYTKFMIARHPFTRLLSAYRDKLQPNGSFETAHADNTLNYSKYFWRKRLGRKIVNLYRGKATALRFREHPEEYNLTFKEFTDYLVDYQGSQLYANDRHWLEMHSICYPCDVEYDFIAKFETLANDSLYFLHSNGLSTHVTNHENHQTNSSTSASVSQFYGKLPVESVRKLYKRYEMDFKLFGYNPYIVFH